VAVDLNDRSFQSGAGRSEDSVINVNTADATQYTDCPGMYPTIAGRIVDHVRRAGRIKSFDELIETEDIVQDNEKIKAILKKNQDRFAF